MNHRIELDKRYFMDTGHRRLGMTLARCDGARVWDDAGKKYLDFTDLSQQQRCKSIAISRTATSGSTV